MDKKTIIAVAIIIGGIFASIPFFGEETEKPMKIEIISTNHTVTGWVDVKVIESEEPKCYYIEDGFKVYEDGERIPLY